MGRATFGIRGLSNQIVRGQIDITAEEANYVAECARLVFRGHFRGSLRDAISLIVRDYCSMFNPEDPYCVTQDDIDKLLQKTESQRLSEALAKIVRKELNGKKE